MNISLITPTGSRPEALNLCKHWIGKQSLAYDRWIIVNDEYKDISILTNSSLSGQVSIPANFYKEKNTQKENLLLGVSQTKGDLIAVIEDDDYYHPDYLKVMTDKIQEGYDVVGEADATFYNLKTRRWRRLGNKDHAGLCQMMFKKELLPMFKEAIDTSGLYIDLKFWELIKKSDFKWFLFDRAEYVVGMKGLPGRAGIGGGHEKTNIWNKDPLFKKLKLLVGDDFKYYKELVR